MGDEINANFYRAFEDRHRGSRELIKSRLRVYLPFVKPLCSYYDEAKAVDLGCGRGEWLELLQEAGFDAQGVDLDNGMLAICRERDLKVQTGEAVSFLKKLPGASQVVVTGFHIAEHIPFPDLQILVEEVLRVLKPGGLLILETPNPENIVVGATNFFSDPTHQRPIPPQLLSFLPEYYGFKKVKTLRLQESVELSNSRVPTLLNVLNGVSPDYAVVAQKTGEAEILAATNPAFETEYGLTLENLASRYDRQAEAKAAETQSKAQQAEERAQQAEAVARQAESKAEQASAKAAEAQSKAQQAEERAQQAEAIAWQAESKTEQASAKATEAQSKAQQAEERAWQAEMMLNSIYIGRSWRITAPLRGIPRAIRRLNDPSKPCRFLLFRLLRLVFRFFRMLFQNPLRIPGAILGGIKRPAKKGLIAVTRRLEKRPFLRRVAVLSLKPFPWVKKFLRKATYVSTNERNAWHVCQADSKKVFPISNTEQVLSIDEFLSRIRTEVNEFDEKKD